jgi:DUF4097 and DUF4098 domain-containing protein YvlB
MLFYKEIDAEKSFSVTGIEEIRVKVLSPSVQIFKTESGQEARFHLYGKSIQPIDLVAETVDNVLSIEPRCQLAWLGTIESTRLDVYLPEGYDQKLSIQTSSGPIKMDVLSLEGLSLNTSSGNIDIRYLTARALKINTTSGAIDIGECYVSESVIRVTSGRVRVGNSQGNIDIQGTSGDVSITCSEIQNRSMNVKTSSGSVTLGLPGTAGFSIETHMISGKLQSDFSINAAAGSDEKNVNGRVGEGDNSIKIETTSGQIKIFKN